MYVTKAAMDQRHHLGKLLTNLRWIHRMPQLRVAQELGIDVARLRRLESGLCNAYLGEVISLCILYQVELDQAISVTSWDMLTEQFRLRREHNEKIAKVKDQLKSENLISKYV